MQNILNLFIYFLPFSTKITIKNIDNFLTAVQFLPVTIHVGLFSSQLLSDNIACQAWLLYCNSFLPVTVT